MELRKSTLHGKLETVVGDTFPGFLVRARFPLAFFFLTTQGHQFFLVSFEDFGGARVVVPSLKARSYSFKT